LILVNSEITIASLPSEITFNKNNQINLKYFVFQKRNNYTHPSIFRETSHIIEYNITFDNDNNWIINTSYFLNFLYRNSENTSEILIQFKYYLNFNTKIIYKTEKNENDINITGLHSYILNNIELKEGETEIFRTEDLFLIFGPHYIKDKNFTFIQNENINISNTSFNSMLYKGNITELKCQT